MFDQSFSSKNIEAIFNIENRKGHIDLIRMPQPYREVIAEIRACRATLKGFRKKKQKDWDESEKAKYKQNQERLSQLLKDKEAVLQRVFEDIERQINDHAFSFQISVNDHGGKQYFSINRNNWPQFYAMKVLQRNLNHLFNVEMLNRHTVMANLKVLLNTELPFYIIRTDVSGFFESIPQQRLLRLIDRNSLLSTKAKSMVRKVLLEYEATKDTTRVQAGKGVPRGIGISSPLSEIFMDHLDKKIRERQEVMFYARYVDDIFIVLSSLGGASDLQSYYSGLEKDFARYGLTLQSVGSNKCKLVDKFYKKNGNALSDDLTYLGYHLWMEQNKNMVTTIFGLSDHRKDTIKQRIDHVFRHFANMVKVNPTQARNDLVDGLNLVTGNIRLSKAKSGVKVGFYYNNDLLDREEDFTELQNHLDRQVLKIPANLFGNDADRTKYENLLKAYLQTIQLRDRWNQRKMYDIGLERIKTIEQWL